ncbi:MAG: OmpA family protein [Burkholderiales bacterium]|nr:OmpA family protein [Burkholderiales bacterium]
MSGVTQAWIRRSVPVGPFVWGGLLPALALALIALFALLPFAHGDIQSVVRAVTGRQLQAAGLGWVRTEVSGQDVDLYGTPPDDQAATQAVQIATEARCPTWAGPQLCAVRVSPHFDAVAVAPAAAPVPAPVAAPAAAPVAAPVAPPASAVAAAQACEQRLAAIVAASRIEFATDSAVITSASGAVLDRLAEAARGCAGTLTVAGHTDATGTPAHNRSLSLARAGAVRDALVARGLGAARMRVEGLGAEHPLASNDDEAGRAINRRIEFHVQADQAR